MQSLHSFLFSCVFDTLNVFQQLLFSSVYRFFPPGLFRNNEHLNHRSTCPPFGTSSLMGACQEYRSQVRNDITTTCPQTQFKKNKHIISSTSLYKDLNWDFKVLLAETVTILTNDIKELQPTTTILRNNIKGPQNLMESVGSHCLHCNASCAHH